MPEPASAITRKRSSRRVAALLTLVTLGFGGCAQQPQQLAANVHSKEYFPASIYGPASRRVIDNGPVPHGGGQYLVGRPYTVAGQTYYPSERKLVQVGNASWYGDAFHGRLTANGEIYDRNSFTAAHPTMPLPSYARVTNLRNNASMIVRVNDRGPFAANRVMDVSSRVAEALDFRRTGMAKVKIEYVGRASLAGSDDAKLYATLRNDGPAQWHESEPTMVADARPVPYAAAQPIVPAATPTIEPRREAMARRDTSPPVSATPVHDEPPREMRSLQPIVRQSARNEPRFADPSRIAMRDEGRPVAHAPPLHWQTGPGAREIALRGPSERKQDKHEPARREFAELVKRVASDRGPRVREPMPTERPGHSMARAEPMPLPRPTLRSASQTIVARAPVPPVRPAEHGTNREAAARTHHNPANLRLARLRDD